MCLWQDTVEDDDLGLVETCLAEPVVEVGCFGDDVDPGICELGPECVTTTA